jgi:rfaE bifunctional protein kinase chain/domain
MKRSELESLLAAARKVRIGVVGDFCLDAYWHLDASLSEISVETGIATRPVRLQRYSRGGAGNVAANLVALGVARVAGFGLIGNDPFGREMLRIFEATGIDARGMIVQESGWNSPVYIKPVEGESEQARIDFGNDNLLDPRIGGAVLRVLRDALASLDLVIVNQQLLRGIHTEEFRRQLSDIIGSAKVPFLCDSRSFSESYAGAIRKVNDREALRLCGEGWDFDVPVPRSAVVSAMDELFRRWGKAVFVTRGPRGILARDGQGMHEVHGLQILGRIDPVGAGDSALAGIATALAVGRDNATAAELGNLAAGVTVQKLFTTGTASPEEILAIGSDPDYVFAPELAEDARAARYLGETEIEIVTSPPQGGRVSHAIFDNDGTISTLREGWEKILEPVMVHAILGEGWKSAEGKLFRRVQERVSDYIDRTTGVQTLVQMHGLVEMVGEFGIVPPEDRKDAFGYKALYNEELLAMVRRRIAKFERGELGAEDYMIRGAGPFLEALRAAGVKMYLTSGTDEEDVVAEATALGYARLFERRILGAVGDAKVEAKKVVLERILSEIGPESAGTLVTFGDGPVEIRETKKRGGFAVGVASDEPRRFGRNLSKRARVIRAGADLVVPDFTQGRALLALFGIRA